jgi:toxin ParE1/3/4
MTLSLLTLPEAEQDIEDIGVYLGERNVSAARRFSRAVGQTGEMLCRSPNLGERFRADLTEEIRYRTISGFKNYLIFYRRVDDVLEIIRVLHGARDYDAMFNEE